MDPQRNRAVSTGRTCPSCGESSTSSSSTVATSIGPYLCQLPSPFSQVLKSDNLIWGSEMPRHFFDSLPNSKSVIIFLAGAELSFITRCSLFLLFKNYLRQGCTNYSPQAKFRPPSFFVNSFTGTQPCSFFTHFPVAVFSLQWESWVTATETIQQTKLKIFTIPLQEMFTHLWSRVLIQFI